MAIADFRKIMEVKRYTSNTIKTYCSMLKQTEGYFSKPLCSVSEDELFKYVYHLIRHKESSWSTQKQLISALKLFYKEVCNESVHLDAILPARKPFKIPEVLSQQEVKRLLNCTKNLKHRCILATMYSAGLRVGELLALRILDIDPDCMVLKVRGGKGDNDRSLPLSQNLLVLLREYYKKYKPQDLLFEGQNGRRYSATSVNQILKKGLTKAGIKKKLSSHNLRHSYATHLLESGTDIRIIQELLGHKSIKSTMIYTHIAKPTLLKVTSPLDF